MFCLSSQDTRADRMKRAEHNAFNGLVRQKGFDARFHLLRGLVGKRYCENLPGTDSLHSNEIRDPLREHPRLTRPWTCYHQNRSVPGCYSVLLLSVEFVEKVHREIESRE